MRIRTNVRSFGDLWLYGLLPSALRVRLYRLLGYRVGAKVKLGFGAVVVGTDVEIADGASIASMAIVRGERIRIGRGASIGWRSLVSARSIDIGAGACITSDVRISGIDGPRSRFVMGENTIVMYNSHIDPTCGVTIGDDSGVGGHCLIFSHSVWLSAFDGYPRDFAPVEIGKSAWLPWGVFVLPGSSVGDGAVIGANSMVRGEIPARALAVGTPARVLRAFPQFPPQLQHADRVALLRTIVEEFVEYLELHGMQVHREGATIVATTRRRFLRNEQERMFVRFESGEGIDPVVAGPAALMLSLVPISTEERTALLRCGADWLDIASKQRSASLRGMARECSLFLNRYGVRFTDAK